MSKILLVDDEAYITSTVGAKLKRLGHEIQTAADGAEGFALAMTFQPDLVVSDLQMPVCTGIEMAMKLAASMPPMTT